MADKRINALTTTSASVGDDYFAIDGATNGTRALSAFSPTFGGNATVTGTLTVNGSGTTNIGGMVRAQTATYTDSSPVGLSQAFQVDTAAASTRDLFSFGDSARHGLIRGYQDGAGVVNFRFGRYAASTFSEYVRIAGDTATNAVFTVYGTTASTTTSTGALVVGNGTSGGLGVGGKVNAGSFGTSGITISAVQNVSVSTTAVDIATGTEVAGLYFVTGYNNADGGQGSWLVMTRGTSVTTISSNNNTGLTVTFSVRISGFVGILQAATASGTLITNATAFTR